MGNKITTNGYYEKEELCKICNKYFCVKSIFYCDQCMSAHCKQCIIDSEIQILNDLIYKLMKNHDCTKTCSSDTCKLIDICQTLQDKTVNINDNTSCLKCPGTMLGYNYRL